jgi:hypothetical protein
MKISTVETAMAICRFQSVGQNYAAGAVQEHKISTLQGNNQHPARAQN